ncbi:FtsX-like permease family protein [Xanthomonas sp. MUS 060]|uniref:ABC transporter permease n=1 Tax=Xanthomonas sp. MUS 060 TaxID=1588031 RepID=UPI0006979395|nr:FtsX-like permease family protein [Xanthomonas sp. MUS 060]
MTGRLLLANLFRWKSILAITLLTVVVAFFFFGLLLSLNRVFNVGVTFDKAERLVVANAVSIMQPLPLADEQRIAEVEGVEAISRNLFFGGFYQEPANGLMAIATEPESFMRLVPEMRIHNSQDRRRWLDDRTSIAVGRTLAERYHWKVGDMVPIFSYLYPRKGGGTNWTFRVAAIYDSSDASGNTNSLLMHYGYVDDVRANGKGTVGWYNVRVRDPSHAEQVAHAIDALFANSGRETHTATEAMFAQELIRQVGDFGMIVRVAVVAVFFTLILVTANGLIHSVSERSGEMATIKALGASNARLAASVVLESFMVVAVGALVGFAVLYVTLPKIAAYSVTLSSIRFAWHDVLWMIAAIVAVTLLTTAVPVRMVMGMSTARDLGRAA